MRSATYRSRRLAVALAAGLVLLAVSACSSASSNSAGGNANEGGSQLGSGGLTVAFSACMRSHGEPKFPDPNSQGVVGSLIQLGIDPNSPQFAAAQQACAHLANGPEPGGQPSASQDSAAALKFAACIRRHGFPNFPDPGSNGAISGNSSNGINFSSPQFKSAQQTCSQQTGYGENATESSG